MHPTHDESARLRRVRWRRDLEGVPYRVKDPVAIMVWMCASMKSIGRNQRTIRNKNLPQYDTTNGSSNVSTGSGCDAMRCVAAAGSDFVGNGSLPRMDLVDAPRKAPSSLVVLFVVVVAICSPCHFHPRNHHRFFFFRVCFLVQDSWMVVVVVVVVVAPHGDRDRRRRRRFDVVFRK